MGRRGWILFALMCLIWGVPYLLIKVAVEEVSPAVLVFGRTAVATLVLLPFVVRAGHGFRALRPYRVPLAAFAVTEFLIPWWLLSDAERRLSSSTSGLLIASVPIFGAVLIGLTGLGERLNAVRWAGLAVGFGGVALLATPSLRAGDPWAVAEVLLTALCYAAAAALAEHRLRDAPTLPMTVVCLGSTAVLYTPFAAVQWPSRTPSAEALTAIGVLGVVCTAVAVLLLFELVREVGAARATVITYVNPAVAVTAGVIVLGEPFTPVIATSFVLILAGAVLATRGRRSARQEPAAEAPATPDDAGVPG